MAVGGVSRVTDDVRRSGTRRLDEGLSIVVPTRGEAGNITPLLRRLRAALGGIPTQVIFVDDSDDGTAHAIEAARDALSGPELGVELLHRPPGARPGGLGGAVAAGLRRARHRRVVVMDADLQHPPELVPQLRERAQRDGCGCVIGSRYVADGSADGLAGPARRAVSKMMTALAARVLGDAHRDLSDPLSGFFLVDLDELDLNGFRPSGFKVLLELLVRHPDLRVAEVGFTFGARHDGHSKATAREGLAVLARLRVLRVQARRSAPAGHCYDIHGLITVESEAALPELEAFRVPTLDEAPTIQVEIGTLPPEDRPVASGARRTRYIEQTGERGFAINIEIDCRIHIVASRLLRRSPHVLYTNVVEPVLRWTFASRGYALVHGACIVDGDRAYMITARTDTGKTTTMLKLLSQRPYGFVADDLSLVSADGTVLSYPKPLTISHHTLQAVQTSRLNRWERALLPLQSRIHSRSGRRFAFLLTRSGLPVATINTLMQIIVPPPKFPVQRLVPGVAVRDGARLNGLFVIARGAGGTDELLPDDAFEILLANCEDAYGFPPYAELEEFLLAAGTDLRAVERNIIARAFAGVPATLLHSTSFDWAERIPALIDQLESRRVPRSTVGARTVRPAPRPEVLAGRTERSPAARHAP